MQRARDGTLKRASSRTFELDEETYNALTVFQRMQSQWLSNDYSGMRTGMNYPALETVERKSGVELNDYEMRLFQYAEAMVVQEDAERIKQERDRAKNKPA